MIEFFESIDQKLLLLINGWNSPFWDQVMWFISGKTSWVPLYLVLLFFLIKQEIKTWWIVVIAVALLITMADQSSVKLFKEVFERYRPCHNLEIGPLVHKVHNKCGGRYGFVSSHAANSFALAGFLSLVFHKKWVSIGLLFWAAVVSYSRIYLGVHYPADVFFGGLLGLLISWLVFMAYARTKAYWLARKNSLVN